MSLLFDRKYSLTVGFPKNTEVSGYSEASPLSEGSYRVLEEASTDTRTSLIDGVEINDLQIDVEIKSNSSNSSNTAHSTIKVYNLSSKTRELIESKGNYIILRAGYAQDIIDDPVEDLPIVFVGQIEEFDTTKEGHDLVTVLYCSDGQYLLDAVRVSKKFGSLGSPASYGDIIEYLVGVYEENGVSRGDIITTWVEQPNNYVELPAVKGKPANYMLVNGYSITGFLHQAMDNICKQLGYVNYITNGKIYVHPKDYTATVEEYEFTSSQMKSIRKFGSSVNNTSTNNGLEGIKVVTFLDSRLDIDKRIKIVDGAYEGTYKIVTKEHKLVLENGAWDTTITCNQVKVGE